MDNDTLIKLEYDRLLELLAQRARTEPGREACLDLRPDLTFEEAEQNWRLIEEAREVLGLEGAPPVDGFEDPQPVLMRLRVEDTVLHPEQLLVLLQVVRISRELNRYLAARETPRLTAWAADFPVLASFEDELARTFGPEGEILDTASPRLTRIRRETIGLKSAIQTRLTGLMRDTSVSDSIQDQIVTQRAGRYVIPVKSNLRRDVPGLVHDYSSSGSTAYVEPLEMVEDNNRLGYLQRQERQEIERILIRLSGEAAAHAEELALAAEGIVAVDLLFAQASLSREQKAQAPWPHEDGGVLLKEARHPLLLARAGVGRVVPVDLRLDADERVVVISGVNAGGKTVALKTLGLLSLMAQTGLHLPVAEGSRIGFFDLHLAAMGDEQDLSSDLSTFSGHVRRLAKLLDASDDRTLVILDELGSGTDPAEGAALALAVLDALRERRVWTAAATHYHLLKAWAHRTPGVVNAAVRTDPKGRPLYGLEYGSPGFSSGLAMAREMGLDPAVVDRAESYLDEGQKKTLALMQSLETERAALAESRRESEGLTEELARARARLQADHIRRERAREEEMAGLRDGVRRALAKAEREFRRVLDELPAAGRAGALMDRYHRAKNDLKQAAPAVAVTEAAPAKVRVGERVLIRPLGCTGVIVKVPNRGPVELDLGGMTVTADRAELARPGTDGQDKPRRPRPITVSARGPEHTEVNILGLTVDEALPRVEKTIDQALVGGLSHLTIIHGIGTGRLKQAVRGYLAGDPRVKTFSRAARAAGGEGVTQVELNL